MATINLGAIKFNWKGAYNSSTSYAVDDVVSSGGNSYVCIQAHSTAQAVGNATAYWNIMSSAGTNGTNGTDVGTTLTTQGDILYRDGSGLQRLPKGTANQVLKMNSGATAPEYGTLSSDYVKLANGNVTSGGSFNIDGYFTNTYNVFKLYIDGQEAWLKARFRFGGSTFTSSNYVWVVDYSQRNSSSNSRGDSGGWNADYMPLAYWSGDGSREHHHSEITLFRPWDTGGYAKNIHTLGWDYNSNETHVSQSNGFLDGNNYETAMSGIHIFPTSGNFGDCTWVLYGLKG